MENLLQTYYTRTTIPGVHWDDLGDLLQYIGFWSPNLVFDSVGLRWDPRMCISYKFTVDPGIKLGEPLRYANKVRPNHYAVKFKYFV